MYYFWGSFFEIRWFYCLKIKKDESQGKRYSETDKVSKMNSHHVPFNQIVAEIRLENEQAKSVVVALAFSCWQLLLLLCFRETHIKRGTSINQIFVPNEHKRTNPTTAWIALLMRGLSNHNPTVLPELVFQNFYSHFTLPLPWHYFTWSPPNSTNKGSIRAPFYLEPA